MLFAFYLIYIVLSSQNSLIYNTTFCVCDKSKKTDCSVACKKFRKIGYNEIEPVIKKYKEHFITFIIYGTSQKNIPEFNLQDLSNISAIFYSANSTVKEQIILHKGKSASSEANHLFTNLKIHLRKGKYDFNQLVLRLTEFIPYQDSNDITIKQKSLDTDFYSIAHIPNVISHSGPSHGITILCSDKVAEIQFRANHCIVLKEEERNGNIIFAKLDLSQIVRGHNTSISLSSRRVNLTFQKTPVLPSEIPTIIFNMQKNAQIFIDSDQFPSDMMTINELTFCHNSKSIYFDSRNGTIIPTFKTKGSGSIFKRNERTVFYSHYCICEGNCEVICGNDKILTYDISTIYESVMGNPSKVLKYIVANSKSDAKQHPFFDLDIFGDRNLTVIGATMNEHIEFTGDATDDVGFHSFFNLVIHGQKIRLPSVYLHDVRFEVPHLSDNETSVLNSTFLQCDIITLQRMNQAKIDIIAPLYGYAIHSTNMLKSVALHLLTPNDLKLNDIKLPLIHLTTLSIYGCGSVEITLGDVFPKRVRSFPKLRIYLEGDQNIVSFPDEIWPETLPDISAKVTLIHGEDPVYVIGNYDGKKYMSEPPIVNHEGSGPIFFNGELNNYKSSYCICKGEGCSNICEKFGPIVDFKSEEISATISKNPNRHIEYFVANSKKKYMPIFNMLKFTTKSFTVKGYDNKIQYISLIGAKNFEFSVSSVSHIFSNVNIHLITHGFYFFNNLEFTACTFSKETVNITNDENNNFHIIQAGMTSDMKSLRELDKEDLLYPSKLYMHIRCDDLKKIILKDRKHVLLFDDTDKEGVQIDISMLNVPVEFTTKYGYDITTPFKISYNSELIKTVSDVPKFVLDFTTIDGDDAYVHFEGKKWSGAFHDLTERITILHGQANIHILSNRNRNGEYGSQQPPHVSLEGIGDYYINNERQVSVFAPGSHQYSDDDDDNKFGYNRAIIIVLLILIVAFFAANALFKRQKAGEMQPFVRSKQKESLTDLPMEKFEVDGVSPI